MIKNVTIKSIVESVSGDAVPSIVQYPLDVSDSGYATAFRVKQLYEDVGKSSTPEEAGPKNVVHKQNTASVMMLYQTPVNVTFSQNWAKQEGIFSEHGSTRALAGLKSLGTLADTASTAAKTLVSSTAKTMWGGNMGASTGIAMNPFLGVSYEAPDLRTLSVPYVFEPRSEKEAKAVIDIIKAFKFYSAPSYNKSANSILSKAFSEDVASKVAEETSLDRALLNAPDAFEIDFLDFNAGGRNKSLFRFGPAVCTDVSCNYSSNGIWRAFENGLPVSVELTLTFQEMEIITREKIKEGY